MKTMTHSPLRHRLAPPSVVAPTLVEGQKNPGNIEGQKNHGNVERQKNPSNADTHHDTATGSTSPQPAEKAPPAAGRQSGMVAATLLRKSLALASALSLPGTGLAQPRLFVQVQEFASHNCSGAPYQTRFFGGE